MAPRHSLVLVAVFLSAQLVSAFTHVPLGPPSPPLKPTYGGQEIVPGSFLIEVGGRSLSKRSGGAADLSQILSHLASPSSSSSSSGKPFSLPAFSTSRTFAARPSLFNGAVVKVTDSSVLQKLEQGDEAAVQHILDGLANVDGVVRAWPLRIIPPPKPVTANGGGVSSGSSVFALSLAPSHSKRSGTSFPPVSAYAGDVFDPHVMTGVDKLHNQGIIGSPDVKLAILDSGVDYLNPLLGGCFGPGCQISFGGDYSVDPPGPTPYTNCNEHGTHVTGIIGTLANTLGFSGVAPGVQIGHYRLHGCTGGSSEDVIVAALTAAAAANVNLVTLSLGFPLGWLGIAPAQIVIERLTTQENIVVTVSAGNYRDEGPFFAFSPAATVGGMSVGSVDVEELPAYPATVVSFGTLPYLSAAPLDTSSLSFSASGYRVYFTSSTTTTVDDACNPLPPGTPDLANMITVVRRGTCDLATKLANVAAAGGKIALVYNSPTAQTTIPYLDATGTGLAAVATLRYEEGAKLLGWYTSSPSGLFMRFPTNVASTGVADNFSGGTMSWFSEFGPTFELFGQPSLSAPGGNILSTFPLALGGLGVISGTSMASLFVAGASALLLSQRKSDNLSPADVRALLTSTASKRETAINGTMFETVLLQGGGLVQVDKAISTRTIVSPTELYLNDTIFHAHTQTITLRNTNSFSMQYTFSSSFTQAYGTYDHSASTNVLMSTAPGPLYPQHGRARFSTQQLTLLAGQTQSFTVTIPQPRFNAMKTARFPLYSGYVDISGVSSDGQHTEDLHVPYFGLSAKMRDMPVLDSTATIFGSVAYPFIATASYSVFDTPGTLSASQGFIIFFRLAAGTRFWSLDIILSSDAPPTTIPTEREGALPPVRKSRKVRRSNDQKITTSGHVAGSTNQTSTDLGARPALYSDTPVVGNIVHAATPFPRDYLVDEPSNGFSDKREPFIPAAAPFQMQQTTAYRVLVRALKITADPTLASSYESWVSYPFTLSP